MRCRIDVVAVTVAASFLLAACSGTTSGSVGETSSKGGRGASARPVALEPVQQSRKEGGQSALDDLADPRLPKPLVDPARIVSGGPPPDGIPAIDGPTFQRAAGVDWLDDGEGVLSLTVGGQTRAYPIQVLIWHEIVNDTVAGTPVTVTYCPLCNSALAFDRRLGKRLFTFGTSGKLYLSDLVMYDRQTESLWSQIEGRAIAGRLTGQQLVRLPIATVTWQQWREAHPDGYVLARPAGSNRSYGTNPYTGYDEPDSEPFLFDGESDDRLPPKERVVALLDGDPLAVPLSVVAKRRVVDLAGRGREVVVFGAGGLRSALDAAELRAGQKIAATGVFVPRADGRRLTFRAVSPSAFVDDQTGSSWNILGEAVKGPLTGRRLPAVEHVDTFWFAWAAFRPTTVLAR
ncbi:MAG: DUF3179 domain-containing protein [Sporichthyaceae bacterium]|nr:DUF3179 domain-containing protein [Sporichthyaceae bacterium]